MPRSKIDFNNQNDVEFLNAQKKRFEHHGEFNISQGNVTERSLSGQLILLTTVLLTVNVLVLGDGNILGASTSPKVLLFLALIAEALATCAGIANYLMLEQSYDGWSAIYMKCAAIIEARGYKTREELIEILTEEQEGIGSSNSKYALYLQAGLICLSLVFYIVLLGGVFFSNWGSK